MALAMVKSHYLDAKLYEITKGAPKLEAGLMVDVEPLLEEGSHMPSPWCHTATLISI